MLHDICEQGCTDYVGGNSCDNMYWTTSDNVPTCWMLADFTYTAIEVTCEATNTLLGAFTQPNDGQRYEAIVGSPIIIGNPGDQHTILLPPNGQNIIVCTNILCLGNPYGTYTGGGTYNIQSDAWNGGAKEP
jgi:hypothetical protein